jgi:hypothetical protein
MAFAKRQNYEDRKLKILRETNDWIGQMKEMGVVMEPKRSERARKDQVVFQKFYKAFCGAVDNREILRESSKPKEKKDPYEHLPNQVKSILELQDEDGKWTISLRKLERVWGVTLPEGRDITPWRWVTALILSFLRSHPEYYKDTQVACDLALFWVRDPALLERARGEMPPLVVTRPRDFELDREMVRQGRYKDAQNELLEKYGYRSFLAKNNTLEEDEDDMMLNEHDERVLQKRKEAKEADVDANLPRPSRKLRTMLDREIRDALKRRHRELCPGDIVLSRFWRTHRFDEPKKRDSWRRGVLIKLNVDRRTAVLKFERLNKFPEICELRVPLEHVRPDKPDIDPTGIDALSKIWTTPSTSRSETLRLSYRNRHHREDVHGPPLRAAALRFLSSKDENDDEVRLNDEKKDGLEEKDKVMDKEKQTLRNELISCVLEHDLALSKLRQLLVEGNET